MVPWAIYYEDGRVKQVALMPEYLQGKDNPKYKIQQVSENEARELQARIDSRRTAARREENSCTGFT